MNIGPCTTSVAFVLKVTGLILDFVDLVFACLIEFAVFGFVGLACLAFVCLADVELADLIPLTVACLISRTLGCNPFAKSEIRAEN